MSKKNLTQLHWEKWEARKGGKDEPPRLSPEERSASAQKAALARWAKQKKEK